MYWRHTSIPYALFISLLEGVGPETHAHETHNIFYRIQNTETHVQKITKVPIFLYGAWT